MSMLPPSRKGRVYERAGLLIRKFAGAKLDRPLNPYQLAKYAKLIVIDLNQVEGLPEEVRHQLLEKDPEAWSAGTTKPLPNGWRLVVLNPRHGRERIAATLMEEICHVWLGHTPAGLHTMTEAGIKARDYNQQDEEAAYGIGAAALVPYSVLHLAVTNGIPAEEIARRYGVSRDLVEFRIKVTHLWDLYKENVLKTTA